MTMNHQLWLAECLIQPMDWPEPEMVMQSMMLLNLIASSMPHLAVPFAVESTCIPTDGINEGMWDTDWQSRNRPGYLDLGGDNG